MLLLLASHAFASPDLLVCNYGDLLSNIVGIARRQPGPTVTIEIAGDCTYDIDEVTLSPSGSGVTEYVIVPEATSGTIDFVPVAVTGGATARLERLRIPTASTALGIRAFSTDLFDLLPGAALYADGATLDLTDVALVGSGGAGLVAVDSDVTGTGFSATGFDERRPVYVIADATRTTIALSDIELSQNGAGAVFLYGLAQDVDATFESAQFKENGPASGADILSLNVASLAVTDATFSSSVGSNSVADGAAAPVVVDGGSLDCDHCFFSGTSGDTATTYAAYLGMADSLTLTGGELAPADATNAVMHVDSGGLFNMTGVRVTRAGELRRYAGTTFLLSSQFIGEGEALDRSAIKLSGTLAELDGLTLCDYTGAGFGLIAAYGSDVTLSGSVAQTLNLGTAPLLKAWNTSGDTNVVVRDNTFAGSNASLVGGSPASLEFENNLMAGVWGGVDVATLPGGAEIAYNLYYLVENPQASGTPDATNLMDVDPLFESAYMPGDCDTYPFLRAGSPANAAGDPSERDDYGNARSDIGALDYDDAAEPGDTDTADTDDTDDTEDPGDSAIDTAGLDTSPDTAGEPALVGGALPPCGCGGGGTGAAVLLGLLPLLVSRRRA